MRDCLARPHHGYLERMMVRTFRASALRCPACQPDETARTLLARPSRLPPLAFSRRAVSAAPCAGCTESDTNELSTMVMELEYIGF